VRLPITFTILRQIIGSFQSTTGSAYQLQMLTAMCPLAFFAFSRVGEITVNGRDHPNLIKLPQLERLVNEKGQVTALQLTTLKYKHSSNGRPFTMYIYIESSCCPVQAILDFVSTQGSFIGPLFCWPDRAPIIRSFFVQQLNRALRFCHPDPGLYKSHSYRIGAASWAAAKGFSDSEIRQLGRWKSNAFLNYIRIPSLSTQIGYS